MGFVIGFGLGFGAGWLFLKRPQWVTDFIAWVKAQVGAGV